MDHSRHWPAWAVLACAAGTVGAEFSWLWLVPALFACLTAASLDPRRSRLCLALAALTLAIYGRGLWAAGAALREPLRDLDGLPLGGSGAIVSTAHRGFQSNSALFRLEHIEGRPEIPPSLVWLSIRDRNGAPDLQIGEVWRVRGRLRPPRGPAFPGAFDSATRLRRQGVFHELAVEEDAERLRPPDDWLFALRLGLLDRLQALFPQPEGGLLTGVVLGETQSLPEPQAELFGRTGTGHLLAASGANVMLVTGLLLWMGARLGYGPSRLAFPALPAIWLYAGLAGFAPSIVRASAMATLLFLARGLGRRADTARTLWLGVLGCLLYQPALLFDAAFQLSAGAVLALTALTPPLESALRRLPRWLRRPLAVALAAHFGLLPLCLWHFQSYTPWAVLANLWIAPPVEALLPLGLLCACLPWRPLVLLTGQLARFVLRSEAVLGAWIGPASSLLPTPGQMLAYWLALAALVLMRRRPGLALACLGLALVLGRAPVRVLDGRLYVRSCRLRGQPVLWLTTPGGTDWLILSEREQLPRALRMLHLQRVPNPQLICWAPAPTRLRDRDGLVFEGTPQRWRIEDRRVRHQEERAGEQEPYQWCSDGYRLEMRDWLDENLRTPIRHRLGGQTGQPAPDRGLVPRPPARPGVAGGAAGDVLPGLHPPHRRGGRRARRRDGEVSGQSEQPL